MPAVAGVHHVRPLDPARHLVRRARRRVTDDDGVDAHGLDGLHRVAQALTLLDRGGGDGEGEHVGRESLRRRLEGEPGAGRVLEEQRRHHLAPECGDLGHRRRSTSAKASATRSTSAMPSRPEVGDARGGGAGTAHLSTRSPSADTPSSPDVDHLFAARREVLADVVGTDGQLAVASVDHDGELDRLGPPEVAQRVEGGPDGAPGEEDVVDQDHHPSGQVEGDVGDRLGQDRAQADVVAVEGDVEAADGRSCRSLSIWRSASAILVGEGDAARLEPDQHDVFDPAVALDHLVRHAGQGALDVGGAHDLGVGNEHAPEGPRMTALAFGHCSSCRVSLTGPTSRSGRKLIAAASGRPVPIERRVRRPRRRTAQQQCPCCSGDMGICPATVEITPVRPSIIRMASLSKSAT